MALSGRASCMVTRVEKLMACQLSGRARRGRLRCEADRQSRVLGDRPESIPLGITTFEFEAIHQGAPMPGAGDPLELGGGGVGAVGRQHGERAKRSGRRVELRSPIVPDPPARGLEQRVADRKSEDRRSVITDECRPSRSMSARRSSGVAGRCTRRRDRRGTGRCWHRWWVAR